MERKDIIKFTVLGIVVLAAAVVAFRNVTADRGPQDWFYDLSEARLYTAPLGSITPLPGVGGESGDGVEAKVVAPEGECGKAASRKVVYLVTYTEEYQRLKAESKDSGQLNETANRSFQVANTLVRRPTDSQWFASDSEEGVKIVEEFNDLVMGKTDGVKYKPCKP